jgi:hypothetical protein
VIRGHMMQYTVLWIVGKKATYKRSVMIRALRETSYLDLIN